MAIAQKHPVWGWLTEQEFKQMMEAPPSQKIHWQREIEKREKEAQKRGRR